MAEERTYANPKPYHSILFFKLCGFPNSHTPSYQSRSLPSVSMEESKHATITYSCSNIVTWDLWMAQRAFVIKRQGNTDQQGIGRIAEAPVPRPPSPASHSSTLIQTCRILFIVRSATLLSLSSEKLSHTPITYCLRKHGNQEVWALSAGAVRRMKTSSWWFPNRRLIKRKSDTINILSPWMNKSAPVPLFALLCHFLTRCWLIHSSSHWHFSV